DLHWVRGAGRQVSTSSRKKLTNTGEWSVGTVGVAAVGDLMVRRCESPPRRARRVRGRVAGLSYRGTTDRVVLRPPGGRGTGGRHPCRRWPVPCAPAGSDPAGARRRQPCRSTAG